MASMAAAIAASRTAVLGANRPLDERERKRFSYFSSLSSMARRIMAEKERVRQRYGPDWERLPPRQQDALLDRCLVQPHVQARYAAHRGPAPGPAPPPAYPRLRLDTGQKIVRFGDEDITWQDEHSAPFSWETKSQMEFSVASLSLQEQGGVPSQNEQRQPVKAAPGVQAPKSSQGNKTPSSDGLMPSRKEEESSFWKINAERSKFEGGQSEFQSLTPSQIKSMEKGEKALTSFYRQESTPKEVTKGEKPSMAKPETFVTPSLSSLSMEWEKPQPSQPTANTLDDLLPEPPQELPSSGTKTEEAEGPMLSDPVGQSNTSTIILKTGFDFLDNW